MRSLFVHPASHSGGAEIAVTSLSEQPRRVVVIGGGITGLATAHALEEANTCRVHVVEGGPRLGGNIVSVRRDGFTMDGGPDAWLAAKPDASRLARAVGLGDELIGTRPDTRKVYIVRQKALHPMPEGLVLGVPTQWRSMASSELLAFDGKLRALLDLIVPAKRLDGDNDESIGAFVARRLGPEIAEQIAEPLLGGIFAGDASALSVRACFPMFVEAEAKYGSILVGMRKLVAARKKMPGAADASPFLSLKGGIGDLVTCVAHRLRDAEVTTSNAALSLARAEPGDPRGRWVVATARGVLHADDVALTLPAHAASKLLANVDPTLSGWLGDVEHASTATVFLAYEQEDIPRPLDAVGFLVPKTEGRPILACTFVSSKWQGRAPQGKVLLRVFLGGAGQPRMLERDDEELVRIAREQLAELMGIQRAPLFTQIFRWKSASPQPTVGHLGRMRRILDRVASHPGLHLGGNGYIGTGIPDSVKQGVDIAARLTAPRERARRAPPAQPSAPLRATS